MNKDPGNEARGPWRRRTREELRDEVERAKATVREQTKLWQALEERVEAERYPGKRGEMIRALRKARARLLMAAVVGAVAWGVYEQGKVLFEGFSEILSEDTGGEEDQGKPPKWDEYGNQESYEYYDYYYYDWSYDRESGQSAPPAEEKE